MCVKVVFSLNVEKDKSGRAGAVCWAKYMVMGEVVKNRGRRKKSGAAKDEIEPHGMKEK